MTNEPVRNRLLDFAQSIDPAELTPTLVPAAATLIARDPFAFTVAVALDRGTRSDIIWTIPYWMRERLLHLDPARLCELGEEAILSVLLNLPRKPRYVSDAPRTILELSHIVAAELGGNAELIWRDRTALQVKKTFMRIYGVGPGIASMAVILLQRCRGVRFPDLEQVNVKPDVHVRRVLYRLGLAESVSEDDAVGAAASLNPGYPGALDPALWIIGRRWCQEIAPQCANCITRDLCRRIGV